MKIRAPVICRCFGGYLGTLGTRGTNHLGTTLVPWAENWKNPCKSVVSGWYRGSMVLFVFGTHRTDGVELYKSSLHHGPRPTEVGV